MSEVPDHVYPPEDERNDNTTVSIPKDPEKKSFVQRVKENPAVLGGLSAGAVLFLVHFLGISDEQAVELLDVLAQLAVDLGIGGAFGVLIRGYVKPLAKE